jgi:hypothetical protein
VAIVYALDKVRGLTVAIWDGSISRDEQLAYVDQLADDPEWRGRLHLSDLTTADEFALPEPELLNQLATTDVDHVRAAILGPARAHRTREFARVSQANGMNAVVREDLARACAWLGIDVTPTRATLEAMRAELESMDAPVRR